MPDTLQEFFDRTNDTVYNLFKDILETSEELASEAAARARETLADNADVTGRRYHEDVWELRRALAFSVASALLADPHHAWRYDPRYVPGWAAGLAPPSAVQGPAAENPEVPDF